ncbi:pyridoxamine 5'-phosphate oxidase family protein [Paracoccus sp. Z330]|uniref:Pyridoxamine 5'-phosphate oxidase family protein n=1 Tax=Paracoccus onchidii TaxID=3017813 RepID=A0ABT4ZD94_9RHOB|nr:pyridoxamine 5'-phosphate oxidase family protein [Paracoccus onchidii]MDB6177340.1 pyridoxamine 5'-phosphate oxidase family protein [Paracoccus onchidii]
MPFLAKGVAMTVTVSTNPFHAGERAAQLRAGAGDVSQWASGFVRDHLPEQHREFHTSLPFLIVASGDEQGRVWTTLIEGPTGFINSPDPRHLTLNTSLSALDPLAGRLAHGGSIGAVGIDQASRRRNRFSGHVTPEANGYSIEMRQTFGNCPQYIHERGWHRAATTPPPSPRHAQELNSDQIARIRSADTLFIGSGQQGRPDSSSTGYDASHRGGEAGFVQVTGPTELRIPDYAGNNFFNTIGNIMADPRVGLLFVDFQTGGLLHLTGRAEIDWAGNDHHDPKVQRVITVSIDKVIDRPAAVSLRWSRLDHLSRQLRLARRKTESRDITSFEFVATNGQELQPFLPGQHLPISVDIPGLSAPARRSYSLSGPSTAKGVYRISVKRETDGLVSRFLHDHLREGSTITAHPPAGDFILPPGKGPVALISAGVGITPMVPMLHDLATRGRPGIFVHGARRGDDYALHQELRKLIARHHHLTEHVFFSQPRAEDLTQPDRTFTGRISTQALLKLVPSADAHFMLCGPSRFISDMRTGLEDRGVAPSHIHFESFGPGA